MISLLAGAVAASEPAGGAEMSQVVIATAGASIATGVLAWLILGHRSGERKQLTAMANWASNISGLPRWAALPLGVGAVSLHIALLGMYWDIALHIDDGRDAGPLANPAHYFILVGLFGVFTAGVLAMALPRPGETPGPASIQITRDWRAPIGGVLMAACGAFALIGFPLDDMWHRLFGQDVTLWGPTHLMLIGGAGMTLIGQAVLLAEGLRAKHPEAGSEALPREGTARVITMIRRMALMGGLLIGISTFQAEFDFGVPQYQQVFQPFMIALAAGAALVAARIWVGAGGAIAAVFFYMLIRGGVSVIVGPVLGQTMPSVPLYFPEAICVELAALVLARRPLAFAALSGVLIGTLGFAGEYWWTQVGMPLAWTEQLLPEGIIVALAGGLAGAGVGALLALGLKGELPSVGVSRAIPAGAGLILAAMIAYGMQSDTPKASVAVTMLDGGHATVRVDPAALGDDAKWVTVTAWQGEGRHLDNLRRTGPGEFRTTKPMPLEGEWKTLVRVHSGSAVLGAPIRLPRDEAIPAPEVPATAQFERPLVRDTEILQREKKDDTPMWLWTLALALVGVLFAAFFTALAWGVGRVGRHTFPEQPPSPQDPQRARKPEPRVVPAA